MKILLVMNLQYAPAFGGGANKGNRFLAEALSAEGHEVRVVARSAEQSTVAGASAPECGSAVQDSSAASGPDATVFQLNGVEVHTVQPGRLRAYVAREIRRVEPAWILVSTEDPGQNLLEASLESESAPVGYLVHTPAFLPFGPEAFFPSQHGTNLVKKCSCVITSSSFVQRYLAEFAGIESTVVYWPVYGHGPYPCFSNFDRGDVTMINPCSVKGIAIFLQLARALPNAKFAAIPGWGTNSKDLEDLRALPNISIVPGSSRIDDILQNTRLLLVPSLWQEAFGFVAVEAMLRGIPVVASDVGGLPEAKLQTGYLIPVNSITQYTDKMDENLIPRAIVPAQDIANWIGPVQRLLTDYDEYAKQSNASRTSALRFVHDLTFAPAIRCLTSAESSRPDGDQKPAAQDFSRDSACAESIEGLIGELSADEQQSLIELLEERPTMPSDQAGQPVGIPKAKRCGPILTSSSQERLWFLDQLEPGNPAFNMPFVLRVSGRLDHVTVKACLTEITRRHEVLRTTFALQDGKVVQIVSDVSRLDFNYIDLRQVSENRRAADVTNLAKAEALRPFDLLNGPLLRTTVIRSNDETYFILLTVHHIVADGWSIPILIREFSTLYDAFHGGRPSPLPELNIQYADYAVWERLSATTEKIEDAMRFWTKCFADGELLPTELPADYDRPAVQTFRGAQQSLTLSSALTGTLRELSRQQRVSFFTTLCTAFQVLLHRLTGNESVVVGAALANRGWADVESLIGCFVNNILIVSHFEKAQTFRELLAGMRSFLAEALANQNVPFETLVKRLNPKRDLSRTPLFQIYWNMLNLKQEGLRLEGLTLEVEEESLCHAKFDMTIYCSESEDEVAFRVVYNKDLFSFNRIESLLTQFRSILDQIASDPDSDVESYSLAAEGLEQKLGLGRALEPNWPGPVYSGFTVMRERRPEAIAVRDDWGSWTYAQLDLLSNRITSCLQSQGITSGSRVAVCAYRSGTLICALLGILKAGASFVILDPNYPLPRLLTILNEAKPAGLLYLPNAHIAEGSLSNHFREAKLFSCELSPELTQMQSIFSSYSEKDTAVVVQPDQEAYVAFTSGSSGRPKGIVGTHLPLANFVEWQTSTFGFNSDDRFSLLSGVGHDPVLREIFSALCVGATICVPKESLFDPSELGPWMEMEAITVAHLSPALNELLFLGVGSASLSFHLDKLRWAFFGGDRLTLTHISQMRQMAPYAKCVNFYGSMETPQAMACYSVPATDPQPNAKRNSTVPIGRGRSGVELLILNRADGLCGIGEIGQIVVRSPYLSKGYLDDDATSKAFNDDFYGGSGARIFRTGDLGFYNTSGEVEIVGRADRQVKIRGFRVELGDIEATLRNDPNVSQAIVLIHQVQENSRKLIIAFIVLKTDDNASRTALRGMLKESLPAFLVPSDLVFIDKLPSTPNRKVDRSALLRHLEKRLSVGSYFLAPSSPTELKLAGIWREVLEKTDIGVHDTFFELGGHSLLAARIISMIREEFKISVPLVTMFSDRLTIAKLANIIDERLSPSPSIVSRGTDEAHANAVTRQDEKSLSTT